MNDYGTIKFHLDNILKEKNMSKNELGYRAKMQRAQLNGYYNNTVTRLDVLVLARMCQALGCSLDDLMEYIPPEPGQN